MALADVAIIAKIIVETASTINASGEKWYKASVAWADYPRKLEALRQNYENFKSTLSTFGMLQDTTDANLVERLQEATSTLQQEEARLKRLQCMQERAQCYGTCWIRMRLVTFPNRVRLSIQSVAEALDDVPAIFKLRAENTALLQKAVLNKPFSFRFSHDGLYVHLEVNGVAVYKALEDPSKPAVVLLHGGPGRGKSTLARHTAFHYKEENRLRSSGVQTTEGRKTSTFDHVFYLECGPKVDVRAKQLELLQFLGFQDATMQGMDGNSVTSGDVSVRRQLSALLWEQEILIILDDVWETEFLQKFVEFFGRKVKCLVTSQNARLWNNSWPIEIQVNLSDARRILASHAGLPNNVIPHNLKDVVDRIVAKTEGHPLALASLATAISKKRSTEYEEWREAEKSLLRLLHAEDTAPILNQKYPRSFWSSMKLSVQSISNAAQQLLLLASICAGPSIPEEAMSILCQHKKMQNVADCFSKLRNDLEDRSLLAIKSQPLIWDNVGSKVAQRTWSLHNLQKQFIRDEMREDIEVLVTAFLSDENESEGGNRVIQSQDTVLTVLCALYFDSPLAERAARKLRRHISNFSELRRHAIEPIIWLIRNPSNEEWSEASAAVARKILCEYSCDDEVKDNDITHLLVLPFSTKATCWALRMMTKISEKPLIPQGGQGMMKALVEFLGDEVESSIREKALRVVVYHARHEEHREFMVDFPGLLGSLVNIISKPFENDDSSGDTSETSSKIELEQKLAAWALANLSLDDGNISKIADYPNALSGLVDLLFIDESPETQWRAAGTLANLSCDLSNMRKIARTPDAVGGLVKLMWNHQMPELQEEATRALANISFDDENMRPLAEYPDAVAAFVELICKSESPDVQQQAARALGNLSCNDSNKKYLAQYAGAVEGLARLISSQDNPDVQNQGARTLANLSLEGENRKHIFRFPNALAGLVKLLYIQNRPDVQCQAARALGNLSMDNQNKRKIVDFPGALAGLVQLLSLNESPVVQKQAAWALANLSDDEFNRKKIGHFPNAIADLAQLLLRPRYEDLQEEAVRTLLNLSVDDQNTRKLAQFPNVLPNLKRVLAHMSSGMQQYAAQTLGKLLQEK